jgi:uncharacterized membrane protein
MFHANEGRDMFTGLMIEALRLPLMVVHIASGAMCLLVGTYLAIARKGTPLHRQLGRIYFRGMMVICGTGVVLATTTGNVALLMIAIFSGYMAVAGYRSPKIRKDGRLRWMDYVATGVMLTLGLGMLVLGVRAISIVLVVFGGIGAVMALGDLRLFQQLRKSVATHRGRLDRRHRIMMSSSLIALWTAFLVNNVSVQPAWVLWLLPTVIGSVAITLSLRRHAATAI